jgi:hypothetical protein
LGNGIFGRQKVKIPLRRDRIFFFKYMPIWVVRNFTLISKMSPKPSDKMHQKSFCQNICFWPKHFIHFGDLKAYFRKKPLKKQKNAFSNLMIDFLLDFKSTCKKVKI